MSSLVISAVAFSCIFGGSLLGMLLSTLLPQHHLRDESRDAIKLGTGMIATLAALALGLLIASAKGTFDTMTGELTQTGATIMLLDRTMAQYGPETGEMRTVLRNATASTVRRIWPEETNRVEVARIHESGNDLDVLQAKLRQLSPRDDGQRWLQSRALQLSSDIAQSRALLREQAGRSSLPMAFLVVLVFWLTIIFVSFGMFSSPNPTVIIAFLVCALSASGALFLVLELDQPYSGLVKISSAPLRYVMEQLGR
jgi:hypothetical protein